jgi:tRNA pseudouridine38-40 synthase
LNYKLVLEYDGTLFHGWQLQPNRPSIQGTVEGALRQILGEPIRLKAAGRTDAGVHALAQVANFHTSQTLDVNRLRTSVNALVRPWITVPAVDPVPDSFDARRDAESRVYEYRIWNKPWISPFHARYSWAWRIPLALEPMKEAIPCLFGEQDFSAFRAAGCEARSSVKKVLATDLDRRDGMMIYTIEATAFLRHMVRNIVGTLAQVGTGELTPKEFKRILKGGDRRMAGVTAPARGLFLLRVKYPTQNGT